MVVLSTMLTLLTGFAFIGALILPVLSLALFTYWVREDSRQRYGQRIQPMRTDIVQKIMEFILSDIPYIFLAAAPWIRRAFIGVVIGELILIAVWCGGIRVAVPLQQKIAKPNARSK